MSTDPRIEAAALEFAADTLAACWHESSNPLDDARATVTAYLAAADKAATITTADEFWALSAGSAVKLKDGTIRLITNWSSGSASGVAGDDCPDAYDFPARVIHFGATK